MSWVADNPPEINRENPTCILFLLDQSNSMEDLFGRGEGENKAKGVADAINRILDVLVDRCARGQQEGEDLIYNYFHVGVIGYGRNEYPHVRPAFGGTLSERELVLISELADNPLRVEERTREVEDREGGIVEEAFKFAVWFDPIAENGTPMCEALERAQSILANWVQSHRRSYPPIVMHLTDGEATDGPPDPTEKERRLEELAANLKALETNHGSLLLFSCHISSHEEPEKVYPEDEMGLPDEYGRLLFRMSSVLAPEMIDMARLEGFNVGDEARGFVFNADLADVIQFIDIGTRRLQPSER